MKAELLFLVLLAPRGVKIAGEHPGVSLSAEPATPARTKGEALVENFNLLRGVDSGFLRRIGGRANTERDRRYPLDFYEDSASELRSITDFRGLSKEQRMFLKGVKVAPVFEKAAEVRKAARRKMERAKVVRSHPFAVQIVKMAKKSKRGKGRSWECIHYTDNEAKSYCDRFLMARHRPERSLSDRSKDRRSKPARKAILNSATSSNPKPPRKAQFGIEPPLYAENHPQLNDARIEIHAFAPPPAPRANYVRAVSADTKPQVFQARVFLPPEDQFYGPDRPYI